LIALHKLPKLFQLWAAKQVIGMVGTMSFLHHQDSCDPLCPSCMHEVETTEHIMLCWEEGRLKAFRQAIHELRQWGVQHFTDPQLLNGIMAYLMSQGLSTMESTFGHSSHRYNDMVRSQDIIGWRRFMEGMVSHQMRSVQRDYLWQQPTRMSVQTWMTGFIQQLLIITHKQWTYQNMVVHHRECGHMFAQKKSPFGRKLINNLAWVLPVFLSMIDPSQRFSHQI